jgi:hypothetical protein
MMVRTIGNIIANEFTPHRGYQAPTPRKNYRAVSVCSCLIAVAPLIVSELLFKSFIGFLIADIAGLFGAAQNVWAHSNQKYQGC